MKKRMQIRKRKVRFLSIRQKFMLVAATCIMLVSFSIGFIAYSTMQDRMILMTAENAQGVASLIANQIDKTVVKSLSPGKEDTIQYRKIRQTLSDSIDVSSAKYIYTLYTDGTTVYYGVDGDQSEDYCLIGEVFHEDYEELKTVFEQGENLAVPEFDTSDGECLIKAYVPMKDKKGNVIAAVGVDCDATEFRNELQNLQMTMILN